MMVAIGTQISVSDVDHGMTIDTADGDRVYVAHISDGPDDLVELQDLSTSVTTLRAEDIVTVRGYFNLDDA